MATPTSELYADDGTIWLRVSAGHSISEDWLRDHAPDLYAAWLITSDAAERDQIATRIEHRLEQIEGLDPSPADIDHMLEAIDATQSWEQLARIHATDARGVHDRQLGERIRAEMVRVKPHEALRADVLLAVAATHTTANVLRDQRHENGVNLAMLSTLLPASDFYERHRAAIDAWLDREISDGKHGDLPSLIASWNGNEPTSSTLHDVERAIVEHVVAAILSEVHGNGRRELRAARSLYERAQDRVLEREWSAALDAGDVRLTAGAHDHDPALEAWPDPLSEPEIC